MDVVDFGRRLFSTADLDPVYVSLLGAQFERPQLFRWLVAYIYFYHCGFACYASEREGKDFWKLLYRAAKNTSETPVGGRWPRSAERRHFRGGMAERTVVALWEHYGTKPESMVKFIATGPMEVRSVIDRAMAHPGCGPWIGFKIADMIDAVVGERVKQDDVSVFLYKTPRQSILENIARGRVRIRESGSEDANLKRAMYWLQDELADCRIPHRKNKRPDWFSLETVWCKHLSHMHGHYPMGKDIIEINHGLEPWQAASRTAKRFRLHMPELSHNGY